MLCKLRTTLHRTAIFISRFVGLLTPPTAFFLFHRAYNMSTKDPTIALLDDLLMSFDTNKSTSTQKRSSVRLDAEYKDSPTATQYSASPPRNEDSNRLDSKLNTIKSPPPRQEIDRFSEELDTIMEDLRNSKGPKMNGQADPKQTNGLNTTRRSHRKSSAVLTELDALLASCDVADESKSAEEQRAQEDQRRKLEEERAKVEERRRKLDEEKRKKEEEEEMRWKKAMEEERRKREEEEQRRKEEMRKLEEQRRKKEEDDKKKLRVLGRTSSPLQEQGVLFTKANEDLAKMLKTLDDRSVTNGDELGDYINNAVTHARTVLSKSGIILQLLETQQTNAIDPTQLTDSLRSFIVYIHNDVNCVPLEYQTTILMEAKKLALSVQTIFNTIQLGGVGVSYEQLFHALKTNLANILKTLKNIAHEKGIETTATLRGPVTKTQEPSPPTQQHHTPVSRSSSSKDFGNSGNRTSVHGINYVPGNKEAESLQVLNDINRLRNDISVSVPPPQNFNITTATANVASVAKGIVARLSSTVFDYVPFVENLTTLHTHLQQLVAGLQLDSTARSSLIQYINAFYNACEEFVTAIASNNHNPVAATVSAPRKNAADTLSTFLKYLHTCISNKRTMCYKCGVTIAAEYVQIDQEKSCCLNCFICVQCKTALTSYFDEGGDLYCREHYYNFLRTKPGALVCRRCDQVILGQYMKVEDGRVWHKDCFVCAMCEKQLLGVFYDIKGQLRCADCSKST